MQVEQRLLQGEQAVPFENDPSGQTVPVFVEVEGGLHFVESVEDRVNPDLQAVQIPVDEAQVAQPNSQTGFLLICHKQVAQGICLPLHEPSSLRKKPSAHWAHFVPFALSTQPALHAHEPSLAHCPFKQLQSCVSLVVFRQTPDPFIPSSQVSQLAGQGWQFGPKKPVWQASQDEP